MLRISSERPVLWLLRLEGAAMAGAAGCGAWLLSATWGQVAVFALAPDLAMAGYAFGPRIGARLYNATHTYVLPALLAALGWLAFPGLLPVACIWLAHIGVDRALGYGLKFDSAFRDTHLGPIGQSGRR